MFYDIIEFVHEDKGETYEIKICPMLYADYDQHNFTGSYSVHVDGREIEVTSKDNIFLAKRKLPDGLLPIVKEKILQKIQRSEQ